MKAAHPLRTLFLAAAFAATAAVAASAQGQLEIVGGDTYDWGTVPPGELKTTIQVRNSGTGELKITKVQPGCGCTAAPIDKDLLQPGEIGKIAVTLDVRNRAGEQHKVITVYSSDSAHPTQIINLKANIKPLLQFEPAQWFLVNDAKVGAEALSTLTIINSGDAPFTVFPPELIQGNMKARFELKKKHEVKPGERLELKAHITPSAAGSLSGVVRVKTSLKEQPHVDFTVYGNVVPNEPAHSVNDAGAKEKSK